MSDKYNFDEKEVFKPMAKTEFDYEKFYPKLMENYCTALSRIEELESRELGYIQSLRDLEARVRELDWISVEDRLPEVNGPYLCVIDWVQSKEVKTLWRIDKVWVCHGFTYPEVTKWRPLPKAE